MNPYKQLSLEFGGIEKTLKSYSFDSSYAVNILPSFKEAIHKSNKEEIAYCLDVIIKWYQDNINEIKNNAYCDNFEDHYRIYSLMNEIRREIDKFDITSFTDSQSDKIEKQGSLIFLSHRSSDKRYADALEKFIVGLGVKNDQLIYTSHPLHKIPLSENIYDYLRKNINRNIFMIILWSNEYLESPACLNEMGAAWIVQCDYTNIYVPQFSFGNPKYHQCAVDTRKMGAVLNGDEHCKQAMIELKDKIQELFNLQNDEKKTIYLIDEFIKEIKEDNNG